MTMRYHDPSLDHDKAVRYLATTDRSKVTEALISIGLNEMDGGWAQNTCFQFIGHPDDDIASAAIVAIGHIARRFGEIDMTKIIPAFEQARRRGTALSASVNDAMDDIEMFT
ncbi:hypothetical protein [Pseudomonas trivialis]|uniref:HEAT repeat domain-containing protein n=1 Tax=Pseudomonas trivialis TaxID=200450 RepID=A0A0R2ZJG1_9PSED|nr:hypothetical protein [Pseudomonas trivialis]KRP60888.1 hypothetical protein TU79_09980 [Pseudomonas trivialis]